MVQVHQPGQAAFRSILPKNIDWQPFPAFPPEARLAVLVGNPSVPRPYLIRVKVPSGVQAYDDAPQKTSTCMTHLTCHPWEHCYLPECCSGKAISPYTPALRRR